MNPHGSEGGERLIATIVTSGFVAMGTAVFGGLVCFINRYDPGFILCIYLFGTGILLEIVGLVLGLVGSKTVHAGLETKLSNCRVMARFGVDQYNDSVPADQVETDASVKPFVRIWTPNRGTMELECAYEVWCQCGEGMPGDVTLKGRWLCMFEPKKPTV